MLSKMKPLLAGFFVVSLLTGCGMGQMKNDLAELREYQKANNHLMIQQQQAQEQRTQAAQMRQAQQASERGYKRLDEAIERY